MSCVVVVTKVRNPLTLVECGTRSSPRQWYRAPTCTGEQSHTLTNSEFRPKRQGNS